MYLQPKAIESIMAMTFSLPDIMGFQVNIKNISRGKEDHVHVTFIMSRRETCGTGAYTYDLRVKEIWQPTTTPTAMPRLAAQPCPSNELWPLSYLLTQAWRDARNAWGPVFNSLDYSSLAVPIWSPSSTCRSTGPHDISNYPHATVHIIGLVE